MVCSNMDGPRDYHTKWSQTKISHDITHMWNLKYDANELIHETETDSQTQRTDLWLPRGREAAKDWEFGISRWRLVYIRWINKVLLYRELYSISYSKPIMEKNKKEYVCVCVCVCSFQILIYPPHFPFCNRKLLSIAVSPFMFCK